MSAERKEAPEKVPANAIYDMNRSTYLEATIADE